MVIIEKRQPTIVFGQNAHHAIQRGIHQIVAPIRPTLGPIARTVAMTTSFPGEPPELLDKGSIIARRIIALTDRDADMGAMLVRGMLWRLHQTVGDGTATAAVLCQSVYDGGLRYLTAGGSPMRLRHYLNEGLACILAELDQMTRPVITPEELVHVADSVCHNAALAALLGETFAALGETVQVDVRTGHGRETTRQYVEGAYWKAGVHSAAMLPGGRQVELENPAVLISDLSLNDPHQVAPVIEAALMAGKRSLVIFASAVSDNVTAFLLANRNAAGFNALAIKMPEPLLDRPATLADLTVLLGGRPFLNAAGDSLQTVKANDLGQAAVVWADKDYVGFVEGAGEAAALAQHIAALRASYVQCDEPEQRARLLNRLGKFIGGSAILWIGGASDLAIKVDKEHAENTVAALRAALREGTLPGGGVALLACQPALRRLAKSSSADQHAACNILLKALEVPFRTITANAGYDPGTIMGSLLGNHNHCGFDVLSGRFVDVEQGGIRDVAASVKAAVRNAVSTAAMALTIDVLVHTPKPEQVIDPH